MAPNRAGLTPRPGVVLLLVFLLVGLTMGLVACREENEAGELTAAGPAGEMIPTKTAELRPTPTPLYDRRSGIPQVDAVLDSIASGDHTRVEALVRYFPVPCVAPTPGALEPILCGPGETEGTLVDTLPVSLCEPALFTRAQLASRLAGFTPSRVYAVYRAPPGFDPPADYIAVMSDPGRIRAVAIHDGEIVKIFLALPIPDKSLCVQSSPEIVEGLGLTAVVLPPLEP